MWKNQSWFKPLGSLILARKTRGEEILSHRLIYVGAVDRFTGLFWVNESNCLGVLEWVSLHIVRGINGGFEPTDFVLEWILSGVGRYLVGVGKRGGNA